MRISLLSKRISATTDRPFSRYPVELRELLVNCSNELNEDGYIEGAIDMEPILPEDFEAGEVYSFTYMNNDSVKYYLVSLNQLLEFLDQSHDHTNPLTREPVFPNLNEFKRCTFSVTRALQPVFGLSAGVSSVASLSFCIAFYGEWLKCCLYSFMASSGIFSLATTGLCGASCIKSYMNSKLNTGVFQEETGIAQILPTHQGRYGIKTMTVQDLCMLVDPEIVDDENTEPQVLELIPLPIVEREPEETRSSIPDCVQTSLTSL